MSTDLVPQRMLHITIAGESKDVQINDLDIGDNSTDDQIKSTVAGYFEFPAGKIQSHEVVRHENGNLTIQPPAMFG